MKGWQYKWVEMAAEWSLLGGQDDPADSAQLEYAFNDLGGKGWELVNVLDKSAGQPATRVVAVFKRPLD